MIKNDLSVQEVKKKIIDLKGQQVKLYVNRGRKKVFRFDATIEGVYGSVFTVKGSKEAFELKHTFSYNDILCGDVKILK